MTGTDKLIYEIVWKMLTRGEKDCTFVPTNAEMDKLGNYFVLIQVRLLIGRMNRATKSSTWFVIFGYSEKKR